MTFSIVAAGPLAYAKAQIEAPTDKYQSDDGQFNRVKEFILASFNDKEETWLNAEWETGVVIEASGHMREGVESVNINIRPMTFAKPVVAG